MKISIFEARDGAYQGQMWLFQQAHLFRRQQHRPPAVIILYLRGCPVCRWYCRACLIAAAVASVPPLKNFTVVYCGSVISIKYSARRNASGFVAIDGAVNEIFFI